MVAYEQSEWFENNVYLSIHFSESLDDKLRNSESHNILNFCEIRQYSKSHYFCSIIYVICYKIAVQEQKSVGQVVRDALQSQIKAYGPTNETSDDIHKSKTIALEIIYIPKTLDEELRRFAFRAEKPKCDVIRNLVRAELRKYDEEGKYVG